MRILHTVSHYYPDNGGGAQEVVAQVSERLAQRGHDVTIATTYSSERTTFEHRRVTIRQFNVQSVLQHSVLGISGEIKPFLDYLVNSDFDIILNYAAQTWHTDLTCRVLPQLRAKTVLAACGYSGLIGMRKLAYWRYFRRLPRYLRQYDHIIYHSTAYQDKIFGDRHGITNYSVIPNGIDNAEFEQNHQDFRQLYGIDSQYLLITVGNHYTNKGHKRVLATFRELNRKDTTLVIIGRNTAPPHRSCWQQCQRMGQKSNGSVILLDNAPRSHVIAAYQSADLSLSGSYVEAFPLVIVESMAAGCPYVAFPAGNIAEMPGGVVVNSIREMTSSINDLLDNRARRTELARIALTEQRAKYVWEIVVNQYETLYAHLLDAGCKQDLVLQPSSTKGQSGG